MRDFFVHLFTPHHTNNHKARVLHIDALLLYVLFISLSTVVLRSIHHRAPDILGFATDIYADQLLESTNEKRVQAGLEKLTMNPQLSQAAAAKAQDMFANNYWAHNSPNGKTPWDFIKGSGYTYVLAGENLAKNFSDSRGVVDAWMASESHRENILKSGYRDVGFAVVNGVLNGEETTLVVQMFGSSTTTLAQLPKPTMIPVQQVTAAPTIRPKAIVTTPLPTVTPIVEVFEAEGTKQAASAVAMIREQKPGFGTPAIGQAVVGAFLGVSEHPQFNLADITQGIAYTLIGFLMVVFIIDAYLVTHRRIVRVSGNNLTHVLFFGTFLLLVTLASRGSIL